MLCNRCIAKRPAISEIASHIQLFFRADQSQKRMESMQEKYNHMHDKVETTKQTLQDAETTLARQDKIRATVKDLQERAKSFEEKTAQRQKSSALFASEICSGFEFPKPLIDYDAEEEQQIEKQIDESIGTFFHVLLIHF